MTSAIKTGIIFFAGAAVGSVVTWFCVKTHYQSIADEEIESVKEMCRLTNIEHEKKISKANEEINEVKEEKQLLEKVIKKSGLTVYSNFSDMDDPEDGPSEDSGEGENYVYSSSPYFIDEEQFAVEALHYQKREIRYYKEDGVYCDEDDEIMEEFVFGKDFESIPDKLANQEMVYVRNDSLEIDYEIQLIDNSYKEAILGEE